MSPTRRVLHSNYIQSHDTSHSYLQYAPILSLKICSSKLSRHPPEVVNFRYTLTCPLSLLGHNIAPVSPHSLHIPSPVNWEATYSIVEGLGDQSSPHIGALLQSSTITPSYRTRSFHSLPHHRLHSRVCFNHPLQPTESTSMNVTRNFASSTLLHLLPILAGAALAHSRREILPFTLSSFISIAITIIVTIIAPVPTGATRMFHSGRPRCTQDVGTFSPLCCLHRDLPSDTIIVPTYIHF